MDRAIIETLPEVGSLEADVLPILAAKGAVRGRTYKGFFLDIGVPDALDAAQSLIPESLRRPAVFFKRDGVSNIDQGQVGAIARYAWTAGAREAIKLVNDAGLFVFVITNEVDVSRGIHDEAAILGLQRHTQSRLRAFGAHVDDFRCCRPHPEGNVSEYAITGSCRGSEPGMMFDILADWPVDIDRSIFIGDKPTDIEAGKRAGLRTLYWQDDDLRTALTPLLD